MCYCLFQRGMTDPRSLRFVFIHALFFACLSTGSRWSAANQNLCAQLWHWVEEVHSSFKATSHKLCDVTACFLSQCQNPSPDIAMMAAHLRCYASVDKCLAIGFLVLLPSYPVLSFQPWGFGSRALSAALDGLSTRHGNGNFLCTGPRTTGEWDRARGSSAVACSSGSQSFIVGALPLGLPSSKHGDYHYLAPSRASFAFLSQHGNERFDSC